jgi:hypothetical protein
VNRTTGEAMLQWAWKSGIVLVLLSAPAFAQKKPSLMSYTSDTGKFRVMLPSIPRTDTREYAQGSTILKITTEKCEVARDLILTIAHCEYPAKFGQVNAKTMLDGVVKEITGKEGKLIQDREITLGDARHPGREFRVEAGKNVIYVRVYMIDRRILQLTATGTRESILKPEVDEFMKSLTLLEE